MDEIRPTEGETIENIWQDYMLDADGMRPLDRRFFGRIALGNGTAFDIGMIWVDLEQDGDVTLLVSVLGKGAYAFSRFVHWSYAMEKLNLLRWDAMNISDFINRQLGLTGKPQGQYIKPCVR